MEDARTHPAAPLTVVELDALLGDRQAMAAHPAVRRLETLASGSVRIWRDETPVSPNLADRRPARAPEVELHGPGAPDRPLALHPAAEYVETFFDALGDPQAAPRGWWHARIWLRTPSGAPPADQA